PRAIRVIFAAPPGRTRRHTSSRGEVHHTGEGRWSAGGPDGATSAGGPDRMAQAGGPHEAARPVAPTTATGRWSPRDGPAGDPEETARVGGHETRCGPVIPGGRSGPPAKARAPAQPSCALPSSTDRSLAASMASNSAA